MPIQTVVLRTTLATAYGAATPFTALASTVPGASAGTEIAAPRQASNWGTAAASTIAGAPAPHNVPSGVTVNGVNLMSALTAGVYQDGAGVTSQLFSSAGTYQVTLTYTQS